MSDEFKVPDEVELAEIFGEPVESAPEDGYWCYEISDARGVTLRFSFSLFEGSVQTALSAGGQPLMTVVHEAARLMSITGRTVRCTFAATDTETTLVLMVGATIDVQWSTLRVA